MPKTESCGRPIADEGRRMAQGRVSSTGKQQSCRIDCEVARSLTKDHEWRRGESRVPGNSRAGRIDWEVSRSLSKDDEWRRGELPAPAATQHRTVDRTIEDDVRGVTHRSDSLARAKHSAAGSFARSPDRTRCTKTEAGQRCAVSPRRSPDRPIARSPDRQIARSPALYQVPVRYSSAMAIHDRHLRIARSRRGSRTNACPWLPQQTPPRYGAPVPLATTAATLGVLVLATDTV